MRVGGLGVVDPGDVPGDGHGGDPVPVDPERAEPVADRHLRDVVRPGQRRCREGVGDDVRRGRGQVADRAQLRRAGLPLGDERPVDQQVLDHADHADGGHAQGEADRAGAVDDVGAADQPLGLGVGDVVDARPLDPFVDAALVGGVVGHGRGAGVPVEVVLGEVQHDGGLGAQATACSGAGSWTARRPGRRTARGPSPPPSPAARRCRPRRSAGRPRSGSRRASAPSWSCRWCRSRTARARARRSRGGPRAAARRARPRPTRGCPARVPGRRGARSAASRARRRAGRRRRAASR